MAIAAAQKTTVVKDYQLHGTDSGSAGVQIALLTKEIEALSEHLREHPKDVSSRRGLLLKVGKRNRLLKYQSRADQGRYQGLIQRLGLRK